MSEWVSVEDRMPEDAFGCLVIVDDTEPMTGAEFLSILPYFVGWDGDTWNDGDGAQCPFEVRYWMPLPKLPDETEKKQKEEQHQQLRSLKEMLDEVLYHEPADSGDEEEDEVWKQANLLFSLLDDFFGGAR